VSPNIRMSLDRADELLEEMKQEYDRSLRSHNVSTRAVHFTHEVCERLRSVLDRLARLYWERQIAPHIGDEDRSKASIYFPIAVDQNSFDSILGRWRWKTVKSQHDALEKYLLGLQPFSDKENDWLRILNELAIASKHIDLIPQRRMAQRRMTVTDGGGNSVSWGPGVTFGSGVSIMGAPVDARTQRIVPTAGISETQEVWVSFLIEGYNIDPLSFCADACRQVRGIANYMTGRFS